MSEKPECSGMERHQTCHRGRQQRTLLPWLNLSLPSKLRDIILASAASVRVIEGRV